MGDRDRLNRLAASIKPTAQREQEERAGWRRLETSLTSLGQAVAQAALDAGVEETGREPGLIRFPLSCAAPAKYVEITPDGRLRWFDGNRKEDGKPKGYSIEEVPSIWPDRDEHPRLPHGYGRSTANRRELLRADFEQRLAAYMSEHGLSI